MSHDDTSPDTDQSPDSPPTSPTSPKEDSSPSSPKQKPKSPHKHKSKSKPKDPRKASSKSATKLNTKPKVKTPKAKTKEQADELLAFLADESNDLTERYNASKRIHSYILGLTTAKERLEYATQFLQHFAIKDEKVRGVFIDFMCKFATAPKFDGLDSFTVILRPFTQLLVDAIQGTGGKNPTNTIKRIVYGFAQIYPVML